MGRPTLADGNALIANLAHGMERGERPIIEVSCECGDAFYVEIAPQPEWATRCVGMNMVHVAPYVRFMREWLRRHVASDHKWADEVMPEFEWPPEEWRRLPGPGEYA